MSFLKQCKQIINGILVYRSRAVALELEASMSSSRWMLTVDGEVGQ